MFKVRVPPSPRASGGSRGGSQDIGKRNQFSKFTIKVNLSFSNLNLKKKYPLAIAYTFPVRERVK